MYSDFYPSDEYESGGIDIPSARAGTPRDVISDRTMSIADKRALLASWASDRRAVENFPALRRLDDGTDVQIDDILEALKALDSPTDRNARQSVVLPFPRHRLDRFTRRDRSEDDDDPPPAPVAMGLPTSEPTTDALPPSYFANQWRPSAVVGQ